MVFRCFDASMICLRLLGTGAGTGGPTNFSRNHAKRALDRILIDFK